MTREENIKLIREKCIEANPEIMELKFGCEVELWTEDMDITALLGEVGKCTKHKKASSCNEDCDIESAIWVAKVQEGTNDLYEPAEWTIRAGDTDLYKILGRPIRLADVLLAMDRMRTEVRALVARPDTLTIESVVFGRTGICDWNLRQDNLTDQSDETLTFLASLLSGDETTKNLNTNQET